MEEGLKTVEDIIIEEKAADRAVDEAAEKAADSDALRRLIKEKFDCKDQDIRSYSPLTLAFIGDCVYEMIVRTVVVERGNKSPQNLHRDSAGIVKANTQSRIYDNLLEEVSEEELDILKRGRNAHFHTKAKNATISEYKKATGLEALFGYLYLTGRTERAVELLRLGLEKCGLDI